MSTVLSANEAFRDAAAMFARGEAPQAVQLLDQLALSHPDDWALQRRILSATGGCQIDAGQWRDAERRLDKAQQYAEKLDDPVARLAVLVNKTSLYLATWQYRALIAATDDIEVDDADMPNLRLEKAAALLNRAQAALILTEFSIAERASLVAYTTLDTAQRNGHSINTIHLAAAGHCLVRVRLTQHNTSAAREIITRLENLSLQERALVHLILAHAATLAELGHTVHARKMLTKLLDTSMPEGLRRDALYMLLRLEQRDGDIAETLRLLTLLSDVVVEHRAAVLHDALNIQEVTDSVLTGAGTRPKGLERQPLEILAIFNSIGRITEASESAAAFAKRLQAAGIAAMFAVHIGQGTRFACAIARGVIMRDFGALSLLNVSHQSSALADASLRSTLRIFDRMGMARDTPEYRVAAFRHERSDGSGLLGVTASEIPIEAQIASLSCQSASMRPTNTHTLFHCATSALAAEFQAWRCAFPENDLDAFSQQSALARYAENILPSDVLQIDQNK